MNLSLPATLLGPQLTLFLLVLARTGAWVAFMPLFGARGTASLAKTALGVSMSLALTPALWSTPGVAAALPSGTAGFAVAVTTQTLIGAAFGWLCSLLLNVPSAAGSLADMSSGLGFAAVLDPLGGVPAATFSRMFQMVFVALCFATDAHVAILDGFAHSLTALPVTGGAHLGAASVAAVAHAVTDFGRATIEVAAPLLGVLFLTDVALGLMARFYPQANVVSIAVPVKALVAFAAAGFALTMLPARIGPMVRYGFTLAQAVLS